MEVSATFDEGPYLVLGSDEQNPTRLCGFDWHMNRTPWNQSHIRKGLPVNGYWTVEMAREGKYRISLRRWPHETAAPLAASVAGGKSLPIVGARLKVGEIDLKRQVDGSDSATVFTVTLPAGKSRLQTWFYDGSGKEICGAYYVEVSGKSSGQSIRPQADMKNTFDLFGPWLPIPTPRSLATPRPPASLPDVSAKGKMAAFHAARHDLGGSYDESTQLGCCPKWWSDPGHQQQSPGYHRGLP